jgi:NitT/TauT family transport system permease protein
MKHRSLVTSGVVACLVLVIEILCRTGKIDHTVMIAPSEMATSLWDLLQSGEFNTAILTTFTEVAISSAVSIAGGFVIGVIIHSSKFLRLGVEPYLASYYAVPTFIFYPVLVTLFGVGNAAIIAIAVLLSIVAMITATLNGLDRLPRVLMRTAQVFRMSRPSSAVFILLPATAPYLFTGARLAIAYSFIGVIASEFILSGSGLGYSIAYAYNNFDNRTMYGLMLLIIIVVSVVNGVLDWFDRSLQRRLRR